MVHAAAPPAAGTETEGQQRATPEATLAAPQPQPAVMLTSCQLLPPWFVSPIQMPLWQSALLLQLLVPAFLLLVQPLSLTEWPYAAAVAVVVLLAMASVRLLGCAAALSPTSASDVASAAA